MAMQDPRIPVYQRLLTDLQIPAIHFRLEAECVRCLLCTTGLKSLKHHTFVRHLGSAKHQAAINRQNQPVFPTPQHLTNLSSRQSPFIKHFTAACVKSDICFDKVCQPDFVQFFETHTKQRIPDATTMRKTYVPIIYNETIAAIREEIGDNPIWVSVDATLDSQRRRVNNVIIGALYENRASIGRLIKCGEIRDPNAENMAAYVTTTLNEFWPGRFDRNRVLLYLTDAAAYMKASADILKRTFPKLVNVTCLAHACHNIAEKVRECYGEVNDVIANAKEVFSKSKARVEIFKEALPDIPLPPRPVTTRWGTWVQACQYYSLYYEEVQEVFMQLEENSEAVRRLQENLQRPENHEEFEDIAAKFSCLVITIKQLQKRGCSLAQVCEIIDELKREFEEDMDIYEEIRDKVVQVFEDNEGLTEMMNINDCIITGVMQDLPNNWDNHDALLMQFAPLTCADVERSFSIYKAYYRSNRQSMKFERLGQHMVINYNKNMGREEDNVGEDSDSDG